MTGNQRARSTDTASRILDVAERIVQTRGFNAFSYADVASELGVTNASLHYHFHGKAELGEALIVRYADRFLAALADIDARLDDAAEKLNAYAALYGDVLRDDRMCLCGILAAEYPTLPDTMRNAVIGFFDENEDWLENVLEKGRQQGTVAFDGPARESARLIVSGLEGAMLVARPYRDVARFDLAARKILSGFTTKVSRTGPARST